MSKIVKTKKHILCKHKLKYPEKVTILLKVLRFSRYRFYYMPYVDHTSFLCVEYFRSPGKPRVISCANNKKKKKKNPVLKQQPDPAQRPRRLQSSQCAAGPSDIIGSVLSETSDLLNQGGVSWVIFLPHTCSDRCNALLRSP